jgi:hypothetical protein
MWIIFIYVIGIILAGALASHMVVGADDLLDTFFIGVVAVLWPLMLAWLVIACAIWGVGWLLNKLFGRDS